MAVGAINPANGIAGNNPVADGEITKEIFLQLLSTQLQHQDPLEPASDVEFIQQMATFAQLEQQQITNSNLQVMGLYESSINNSNALNLVGKEVKIQDTTVDHVEGQEHSFIYEGADEAARVQISVLDSEGREVFEQTLVGSTDGDQDFTWHGVNNAGDQVADGEYTLSIKLENAEGELFNTPIYQRQLVTGISYENGQILALVGDERIPIENVVEVYGVGIGVGGGGSGDDGAIGFKNGSGQPLPFQKGTLPFFGQANVNTYQPPFRVIPGGR